MIIGGAMTPGDIATNHDIIIIATTMDGNI